MNFLEALGDLSLRRLYKFVIKGIIGRYLENELLIDQLNVRSRDGLVTLSALSLNCDVLNEEILQASKLPFKITKATLDSLEVKLSYTLLLAEGCQIAAKGLRVVVEPLQLQATSGKERSSSSSDDKDDTTNEAAIENNYSNDDSGGLEFIARWIEIIVASLQFHVEDVVIILQDSFSGLNKEIHFSFKKISFYNTHPQAIRHSTDTSASLSVKSVRFQPKASSMSIISNKKVSCELIIDTSEIITLFCYSSLSFSSSLMLLYEL
jgi:hypothetical protein